MGIWSWIVRVDVNPGPMMHVQVDPGRLKGSHALETLSVYTVRLIVPLMG